jgi:hypothetical protein
MVPLDSSWAKARKNGLFVMPSTAGEPFRTQYALNNKFNMWGAVMLTKPGNTQIYSLFGSYVVEQHGQGVEKPQRTAVPEPPAVSLRPVAATSSGAKEMPKAA